MIKNVHVGLFSWFVVSISSSSSSQANLCQFLGSLVSSFQVSANLANAPLYPVPNGWLFVACFFIATMLKLRESVAVANGGHATIAVLKDTKHISPVLLVFVRDGAFYYLL